METLSENGVEESSKLFSAAVLCIVQCSAETEGGGDRVVCHRGLHPLLPPKHPLLCLSAAAITSLVTGRLDLPAGGHTVPFWITTAVLDTVTGALGPRDILGNSFSGGCNEAAHSVGDVGLHRSSPL